MLRHKRKSMENKSVRKVFFIVLGHINFVKPELVANCIVRKRQHTVVSLLSLRNRIRTILTPIIQTLSSALLVVRIKEGSLTQVQFLVILLLGIIFVGNYFKFMLHVAGFLQGESLCSYLCDT